MSSVPEVTPSAAPTASAAPAAPAAAKVTDSVQKAKDLQRLWKEKFAGKDLTGTSYEGVINKKICRNLHTKLKEGKPDAVSDYDKLVNLINGIAEREGKLGASSTEAETKAKAEIDSKQHASQSPANLTPPAKTALETLLKSYSTYGYYSLIFLIISVTCKEFNQSLCFAIDEFLNNGSKKKLIEKLKEQSDKNPEIKLILAFIEEADLFETPNFFLGKSFNKQGYFSRMDWYVKFIHDELEKILKVFKESQQPFKRLTEKFLGSEVPLDFQQAFRNFFDPQKREYLKGEEAVFNDLIALKEEYDKFKQSFHLSPKGKYRKTIDAMTQLKTKMENRLTKLKENCERLNHFGRTVKFLNEVEIEPKKLKKEIIASWSRKIKTDDSKFSFFGDYPFDSHQQDFPLSTIKVRAAYQFILRHLPYVEKDLAESGEAEAKFTNAAAASVQPVLPLSNEEFEMECKRVPEGSPFTKMSTKAKRAFLEFVRINPYSCPLIEYFRMHILCRSSDLEAALTLEMEEFHGNSSKDKMRTLLEKIEKTRSGELFLQFFQEVDLFHSSDEVLGKSTALTSFAKTLQNFCKGLCELEKQLDPDLVKHIDAGVDNFPPEMKSSFRKFFEPLKREFVEMENGLKEDFLFFKNAAMKFEKGNLKHENLVQSKGVLYQEDYNRLVNFFDRMRGRLQQRMNIIKKYKNAFEFFAKAVLFCCPKSPHVFLPSDKDNWIAAITKFDINNSLVKDLPYKGMSNFPMKCHLLIFTVDFVWLRRISECISHFLPELKKNVNPDPEPVQVEAETKLAAITAVAEADVKSTAVGKLSLQVDPQPVSKVDIAPAHPTPVASPVTPVAVYATPLDQLNAVFREASSVSNLRAQSKIEDARHHFEAFLAINKEFQKLPASADESQVGSAFNEAKKCVLECNLAVEALLRAIDYNRDQNSTGPKKEHSLAELLELNSDIVDRLDPSIYDGIREINRAEIKARKIAQINEAKNRVEALLKHAFEYKGTPQELAQLKHEVAQVTEQMYRVCNGLLGEIHRKKRRFAFPDFAALQPKPNQVVEDLVTLSGKLEGERKAAHPQLKKAFDNILKNHMRTLQDEMRKLEQADSNTIRSALTAIYLSQQCIVEEMLDIRRAMRNKEDSEKCKHDLVKRMEILGYKDGDPPLTAAEWAFLKESHGRLASRFTEGDRAVAEADRKISSQMHASVKLTHLTVAANGNATDGFTFQKGDPNEDLRKVKKAAQASVRTMISLLNKLIK